MMVVEVCWDDAFIDTKDVSIKQAQKCKPVRRFTIGYLVAENDTGLVLSTDYFPLAKKAPKEVSAIMVIPWGMIDYWEYQDVESD